VEEVHGAVASGARSARAARSEPRASGVIQSRWVPASSLASQGPRSLTSDLHHAERWLEGLIDLERPAERARGRLSLAPIRALLERVGNPERRLRPIHVAGSKGKGSTALLAEALLRGAGLRVGTFTSPHLVRWTERFRIDGREVEPAALAAAVERLRPCVEALRREAPERTPTFFDATTAAALLLFAEASLDATVLEVGLGGRLDSTNVVESAATCITSIELEHTDVLGDSQAAIAAEKAGILKPGVPAVLGRLPAEARAVAKGRAEALGCPLAELDRDFSAVLVAREPFRQRVRLEDGAFRAELWLPLLGAPARDNASLAAACALRSGLVPPARLAASAPASLGAAALPGRIELLGRAPLRIADGAHTSASLRALLAALDELPRARTLFVLSVSAGKDAEGLCRLLAQRADHVTLTRADPRKSLDPVELAPLLRALAPGLEVRVVPNPHLALRAARAAASPADLVCATGSVYLAGIARAVLAEG
jgi:dihydrofolate synthase/folylpolyglutamate synthase